MYHLAALDGKHRGNRFEIAKDSFVLGKNPHADLHLTEAGVWKDHAQIEIFDEKGPKIFRLGEGILIINSEATDIAILRNGDLIQIGGASFRFGISPAQRRRCSFPHRLVWICILFVIFAEIFFILWLQL